MKTESIKQTLSDITKKAITDKIFATKQDEMAALTATLAAGEEENPSPPDINIEEIVDEIIEFVYIAAADGQYEFEVGDYIQKFGARNYDIISSRLREKLYDVMIIKWRTRNNLIIYWGNSEA